MRTSRMLTIAGFLAALVITCGSAAAQQSQSQSGTGDPVADAARKAREEKKNAAKPKHVLTDDDIAPKPAAPRATSTTGSATAQNSTAAAGDDAGKKEEAPNSEGAWRKKFAAQRKKIADAQLEYDVLQREIDKADVQYYSDPTKAMNEQYSRAEINTKTDKADAKKKEIANLQQQLSDMEDDLRKSGGDPGWAR